MAARESSGRDVILYELNEVPWEIVDRHIARRPGSNLATLVTGARCQTTVNPEQDLQPWRTWPTFHKGLPTSEHGSVELGQDPATFRGESVWDVAEANGLSVGIFGALQSWPAREPRHGGFYVPDTFSRTPDTHPPGLRRFQEFNLSMTREQGFSSTAPLGARRLALAGLDLLARGFTPRSASAVLAHLVRELRDDRNRAARPMVQVLPAFDLYWRLHRRMRPNLSIFFTNHVAGMMHRYWGDAIPGYAEQFDYSPDPVFAGFVDQAMDIFDRQLGRIMRWQRRHPHSVLVVASSMGQHPIPYSPVDETYVVEDSRRLAAALELGPVEPGLAMYPRFSLRFPDVEAARRAQPALESVTCAGKPLLGGVRIDGSTVSVAVRIGADESDGEVRFATARAPHQPRHGTLADLGIKMARRLGGGNTAYHSPEGVLITFGRGIRPDPSRHSLDVLSAGAVLLDLLGLPQAAAGFGSPARGRAPQLAVSG